MGIVMQMRGSIAAVASVVIAFMAVTSAPALEPVITHSVNRTAYTAVGRGTLHRDILLSIGGVHSQTHALLGPRGVLAPVSIKLNMAGGDYTGSLAVSIQGGASNYRIRYDDLVPIALFIDGNGTSIYTYWDEGEQIRDKNFRARAGFTSHEKVGLVAIEFARSQFSEILYFIDFCEICLGRSRPDIVRRLGGTPSLPDHMHERDLDGASYINTDAGLIFGVSSNTDAISVNGNIARLFWFIKKGEQYGHPYNARSFKTWAQLDREVRGREKEVCFDDGLYRPSTYERALALHRDAQFLYASLALLRTFKSSANASEWTALMSQVRALAGKHPEPWRSYSRSYCEVYPTECKG